MLILLTLHRLIISFASGCMRSAREPWLYLIGYFLSFIPSMLTFIVFMYHRKTINGNLIQWLNKQSNDFVEICDVL
jgi:hypothetical protein